MSRASGTLEVCTPVLPLGLPTENAGSVPRSGEDRSVFSVSAMAIATMFPKVSGTALSTCYVVRALAKP